ncbi:MAG: sulfatase-like hydrolase/transferase [Bacteroidetes bacterium]|nr:sulfatase-like hydrolase/transferase [Bacteroidota bacterium]
MPWYILWFPSPAGGGIWYQGESNAAQPDAYVSWFGDYICMMREKFNNSGMPFYFVQLAGFENQHNTSVPPEIWAVLADGSVLEVEGRIKSDHTIEIKASNMERLRYAYGNYPEVENKNHMPLEVVTLAERLKESGYHTAHIGKWHLTTSYPGLEMEGSPEMTKCYDFYF